ncbi:hypothetical protein [Halostella pelagica]|uniref:hypothetical protein n=1 Tax=Halostella pelagica TaxID=2583824 RepID=UPI001081E24C|nr:hypothetical protein [Halostella pelagica]
MTDAALQTEFEFTLPRGYVDDDGTLHKEGRIRLATAADEIKPLKDPRVQSNSSYLTVLLLGRVVTELGDLETVDEGVIENLFVTDLEYLQAMYERINNQGTNAVETACPDCGEVFEIDAESGSHATPSDTGSGMEPTGMDATGASTDEIRAEFGGGSAAGGSPESEFTEATPTEEAVETDSGNPTE